MLALTVILLRHKYMSIKLQNCSLMYFVLDVSYVFVYAVQALLSVDANICIFSVNKEELQIRSIYFT